MAVNPRSERFFLIVPIVMIGFILIGFGSALAAHPPGQILPDPIIIVHALTTLAWFVLTIVQAQLIRHSSFALHRKLGWTSCGLAAAIVVLGYFAIVHAMANPEWTIAGIRNPGAAIFPFFDLVTFVGFFVLGVLQRGNREAHKRLMALAGVMMMDAAVARAAIRAIGVPEMTAVIELAVLLAFPLYDWRTRGKPHWASLLGLAGFIAFMSVRQTFGASDGWAAFATALFG